jgi:8-oxo-dGTP diphosphatase
MAKKKGAAPDPEATKGTSTGSARDDSKAKRKARAAKAEKKARKKAKKILAEQPPLVVAEIAERVPATFGAAARSAEPAPAEGAPAPEVAAPRPLVTVTSAVLSLAPDQGLSVVLVRTGDEAPWTLPAAPLAEGEEPAAAVARTVPEQSGVVPSTPVQLQVLLDPDAGAADWVLTVAHLVTVLHHRVPGQPAPAHGPGSRTRRPVAPEGTEVALAPVAELADDSWSLGASHREVVERAVETLRSAYRTVPDPHGFLAGDVTLSELRAVHEAIGGEALQPDTFRRAMLPRLSATGEKSGAGRGRPAALYRIQR